MAVILVTPGRGCLDASFLTPALPARTQHRWDYSFFTTGWRLKSFHTHISTVHTSGHASSANSLSLSISSRAGILLLFTWTSFTSWRDIAMMSNSPSDAPDFVQLYPRFSRYFLVLRSCLFPLCFDLLPSFLFSSCVIIYLISIVKRLL